MALFIGQLKICQETERGSDTQERVPGQELNLDRCRASAHGAHTLLTELNGTTEIVLLNIKR